MAGESNLQGKCRDYAKSQGLIFRKLKAEGFRGFPDSLVVFPYGLIIFIEFKNPNGNGRLSEMQKREIKKLRNYKVVVFVVDNFEDFKFIIDEHNV